MKRIELIFISFMLFTAFKLDNTLIMEEKSIYKSKEYKQEFMLMYEEKLKSIDATYTDHYIKTKFGTTHILEMGDSTKPPLVVLHGVMANAPIAIEPIKGLLKDYHVYGVDILGQPNKSDENRLPLKDDSFGKWLVEVLDSLELDKVPVIGASYGGFILQRLISYAPDRVSKTIFVVPGGFTNGNMLKAITRVVMPMSKYKRTKSEEAYLKFYDAFHNERDAFYLKYQKLALDGIHMDTRRPPLITKKEAANYKGEVYIIAAGDDIFFTGQTAIKKCKAYFPNFKDAVLMEDSKHIPVKKDYPLIEKTIRKWLGN